MTQPPIPQLPLVTIDDVRVARSYGATTRALYLVLLNSAREIASTVFRAWKATP